MMVAGGALATNYRGLATKHVRLALRWSPRFRRRTPDAASLVLMDRIAGAVCALAGAAVFLPTLIDLVVAPHH